MNRIEECFARLRRARKKGFICKKQNAVAQMRVEPAG